MTDTTIQMPQRLCGICKTNMVRPYQNGADWIYPEMCVECENAWFADWARRMNEEIDKIRRIINQRNQEKPAAGHIHQQGL